MKLKLVVKGPTACGKTTLLNAIIEFVEKHYQCSHGAFSEEGLCKEKYTIEIGEKKIAKSK